MFSVGSMTCLKPGLMLKTISKSFVCELFPIFFPFGKGKNYLIINETKFMELYESLL